MIPAILLLILIMCYLLALRGRRGHPGLEELKKWRYAHRGLYGGSIPENSMEAFRQAFDRGFGIEFDLHLLKDGNIAISHDSDLKRMTGEDRILETLSTEDLHHFHLRGTQWEIPTFREVLDLCCGRVPLIIELKSYRGNADQLTAAACRMLEGYDGPYCLESFDPRCVRWLKLNRPEIVRGQLSENFLKNKSLPIAAFLRFLASCQLETFWTSPDFIAHRYEERKTLGNFLIRKLWKVQGVTWTVRSEQALLQAEKEGWIPIFEGFLPEDPHTK